MKSCTRLRLPCVKGGYLVTSHLCKSMKSFFIMDFFYTLKRSLASNHARERFNDKGNFPLQQSHEPTAEGK